MSKLESLQAELLNDQTEFMRKLAIKDEIRSLQGKVTVDTCNLGESCENCSG